MSSPSSSDHSPNTPPKFAIHEESSPPDSETKTFPASGTFKPVDPNNRHDITSAIALVTSKMSNLVTTSTSGCGPDTASIKVSKLGEGLLTSKHKSMGMVTGLPGSLNNVRHYVPGSVEISSTLSSGASPKFRTSCAEDTARVDTFGSDQPPSYRFFDLESGFQKQEAGQEHPKEALETSSSGTEPEIIKLRKELAEAKDKIAALDVELTQQRITHNSLESILRSPGEVQPSLDCRSKTSNVSSLGSAGGVGLHPNLLPTVMPTSSQETWNNRGQSGLPPHHHPFAPVNASSKGGWNATMPANWPNVPHQLPHQPGRSTAPQGFPFGPQPHRPANLRLGAFENHKFHEFQHGDTDIDGPCKYSQGPISRPDSSTNFYPGFAHSDYSNAPGSSQFSPPMTPMALNGMVMPHHPSMLLPQRPIGTPLSPTASEFSGPTSTVNSFQMSNWNGTVSIGDDTSVYVAPSEPMNYRRLLDKNTSCDWKYIVDKIVCSNDQQASIFLQQKLKSAPADQKYEMIDAIINHSYPLMINRFGNFLIQRCLEHGTEEQVEAIATSVRGNVLNLSMDAFGCHVIQKVLDVVSEPIKASMVNELLHRIPDTVIHRYACHVWQKLFELRWTSTPPQIMKRVNEALRGMWHEVALGETGSLVVQNIFENCLEEDKRPCINEVLANIDIVAHGQFGNWCIQHICEHGLPADKSRAVEHVLRFASEYSTDQFASKVVEKCLKVGKPDFIDRYLERVCEARPGRPRMPLIDIAGDQYGNYLIQFILIHAGPQHRDLVSNHIRKHMVSLRGSKFGSRVAMLCSNPAFSTRPGPPLGVSMGNRFVHQPPVGPPVTGVRPPFGPSYR